MWGFPQSLYFRALIPLLSVSGQNCEFSKSTRVTAPLSRSAVWNNGTSDSVEWSEVVSRCWLVDDGHGRAKDACRWSSVYRPRRPTWLDGYQRQSAINNVRPTDRSRTPATIRTTQDLQQQQRQQRRRLQQS